MSTLSKILNIRNWQEHWIISSVLLWSAMIISISLWYVAFGITRIFSAVTTLATLGFWYAMARNKLPRIQLAPADTVAKIFFSIVIIANAALASVVWNGRTDSALQSPWEIIPTWFFAACAITLVIHVAAIIRTQTLSALSLLALISQFGLLYGVALLAFRFGYAYDPIIHQAAENYVVAHGKISPLQPFYIGQYALVAVLHFISNAPVWLVDRLLLPLLSVISIPIIGYIGLTRGWNLPHRAAHVGLLALTCLPLAEFTFTVPHNITVLYSLWWVLLLPLALRSRGGIFALVLLVGATSVTHPLLGIPLAIATLSALLITRYKSIGIPMIGAITTGSSILFMLGVYRLQQHLPFLVTNNPTDYIENFIAIFEFSYTVHTVRPLLQLLYGYAYLVPIVIAITGTWFAFREKQIPPAVRWTLLSLIFGVLIAIFLVSTLIYIPGIADHEQNEFMLRLRYMFPLFVLPLTIVGIYRWIHTQQRALKFAAYGAMIVAIMISFYFAYPRVDGVTRPGWNVSRSDIEAVRAIAHITNNKPYVVLGNQILAVTGLRELGFDQRLRGDNFDMYPYPISITETLHPITQEILYQELSAPTLRAIAQMINGSVFVAVHDYWYRAPDIFTEARNSNPDSVYSFGQITVFEFKK